MIIKYVNEIKRVCRNGFNSDKQLHKSNIGEYEEGAIKVLEKYFSSFNIYRISHDFYFEGDKEKRDIYQIRIESKNGKQMIFKFGNSIDATLKGLMPSVYSIIACLQKYEVGTLQDFCNEFDYNIDSIKHNELYKAVCKEYSDFSSLFDNCIVPDDVIEIY